MRSSSTPARIVAELVKGKTAITNVAHSAGARLYPNASRQAASFTVGGSRLKSDHTKSIEVAVGKDASLSMTTAQETSVLRSRRGASFAKQELQATVAEGGLYVHTPNAINPGKDSRLSQCHNVQLSQGASAVVVDLLNCARVQHDESWSPSHNHESESIFAYDNDIPFQITSLDLGFPRMTGPGNLQGSYASVVAVGPRAAAVSERLHKSVEMIQEGAVHAHGGKLSPLADAYRLTTGGSSAINSFNSSLQLHGQVYMEVSDSESAHGTVTTAKFSGENVEEIVRVLHHCLSPLEHELGEAPYANQLHSMSTSVVPDLLATAPPAILETLDWKGQQHYAMLQQGQMQQAQMA